MTIKAQIMFVLDMCQPILDAMSSFESQKPCTLSAFDKLEELLIALEANALTAVVMDKFHNESDCDTLSFNRRTKNIEIFHDAFQAAADKLHKYGSEKDGGQPAIKFLKAVRILDPSRVCVVSHRFDEYLVIPEFDDVPKGGFDLYVAKAGPGGSAGCRRLVGY
jgi:hypothetical protein